MRFVRALLPQGEARRDGEVFVVAGADRAPRLDAADVRALVAQGVLAGDARSCRPAPEASAWLRRQILGAESPLSQHRHELRRADGTLINLAESPLARLAVAAAGEAAFLEPHHVDAGERVRRLVERAHLRQRVTMSYDATRTASSPGSHGASEIADMAADARRELAEIARVLPRDCAEVVFDVCGLLKGLQLIETERRWPRRSAKLVLRVGLDHLARYYGIEPAAVGQPHRSFSSWMDGVRPELFG